MTTDLRDPRSRRYERQRRLADIGASGQAKLCAATVVIRSQGFVRTIEERYALASGMTELGMTEPAPAPTVAPERVDAAANVDALGFRHAAAREVAEGALRALAAIRIALGEGT
jgi:hypothetical protein